MSERIHALAQRLLGKATIEECDLQEVKNLAQRFPYFAPAQFLLLEKLKQEGSEDHPAQLQKSILYYHDPLSFQYFIDSDRFYTQVPEVEAGHEEQEIETPQPSHEALPIEIIEQPIADSTNVVVESEPEIVQQAETPIDETQTEITEPQKEQPQTQNSESQTPNPEPATGFTFEPYHTVDYFASQGIKLSQEEIPKDKFGKQLKSFTEWLKTMKRIAPTQMTQGIDAGTENKVQHLADDSIHDSSVLTEAMAEVWIKQGNNQKALKIYEQLSLLNPSKKAYFATKIENLKRS
ncbi:MAG: hypothetical protein ACTHMD_00280 [Flavisolibacter sp.]